MPDFKELFRPLEKRFLDDVQKIKDNELSKIKSLEQNLSELADQKTNLKELEKESRTALKKKKDLFEDEVTKVKKLQVELQKQVGEQNKLNKETEEFKYKAKIAFDGAAAERDIIVEERKKQQEKTKRYQQKIDLLKEDEEKSKETIVRIGQMEKELKAKQQLALKHENANIQKEHELGERELDIRTKEKNIHLEYKRLKLDGRQ